MIRKANIGDISEVAKIYDEIHGMEEAGLCTTGWIRNVYPVDETAASSQKKGELYVMEDDNGSIVAAARFNKEQEECYKLANWQYKASDDDVFVIHTLTVSPKHSGKGYAREFVKFYEDLAIKNSCSHLRMDTNSINERARQMYSRYGFSEAGIVPCSFNGIPNVNLVCLEKRIE